MSADALIRLASHARLGHLHPPIPHSDEQPARELLRDLRDMLFVIAGATSQLRPKVDPQAAAVLDRVVEAAREASDRARALAELMAVPTEPTTRRTFDANARLRASRASLEALLPPGSELRLRLAAGLWRSEGDQACFDRAVATIVARAAEAMRRNGLSAPVAILTSNRSSVPPNGRIRVSVVGDMSWMSDEPSGTRTLREVADGLARCGGRLVRADRPGSRAAVHIDLRRSDLRLG